METSSEFNNFDKHFTLLIEVYQLKFTREIIKM